MLSQIELKWCKIRCLLIFNEVVFTNELALGVETFRMMLVEALEKLQLSTSARSTTWMLFSQVIIVNGGNCDLELYNTHEEFKDCGLLYFFVSGTGGNARFSAIHE